MVLAASRRVLARILVVAAATLAVSCGNSAPDAVLIGAGDTAESALLAEIYAGALARTGARVSVVSGLGDRGAQLAALDADRVQLLGEQSGDLLAWFDSGARARTPEQVVEALNRALPEGLVVADPADGTDLRPRLLVSAESAERDGLRTVRDLGPRCAALRAGAAAVPELLELPVALRQVAGCGFAETVALPDPAAVRNALRDGTVQVGVLSGPPLDPALLDGLVVLSDPEYALRAQQVLPVLRKGVLDDRQLKKLNYVAGELTTDELRDMVRRLVVDRVAAAELARGWLDQHGL